MKTPASTLTIFGVREVRILAIDPGPLESAWVIYEDATRRVCSHAKVENDEVLAMLSLSPDCHEVVIEMVACYGMAVGAEVFETVFWIGRFWEIARRDIGVTRLYRKDVKMHLCNSMRAKDGNIRQALIDKLGAPGTKKNPSRC